MVYDVTTGKLVNSFPALDCYLVTQPIISPDGNYVMLAEGRVVFTPIEVATGKPVTPLVGPSMEIEGLSFTPNGNTLVVGSRDKCQAWDVTTATPETVFDAAFQSRSFAAVDDVRVLMCGSSNEVARLLEIKTGAVVKRYDEVGQSGLGSLQLSDDRREFTAIGAQREQRIARCWGIESGKLIADGLIDRKPRRPEVWDQFDFVQLVCGGRYVTRLDRVRRPSKRANGSIDMGRIDLVLED